jgi:hypothetical protein
MSSLENVEIQFEKLQDQLEQHDPNWVDTSLELAACVPWLVGALLLACSGNQFTTPDVLADFYLDGAYRMTVTDEELAPPEGVLVN